MTDRHLHSTIRVQRRIRPNAQVRGPYSRYRSRLSGFLHKTYQGHLGLVVCQSIGGGIPVFIFRHQVPTPNQKFSAYCDDGFFSSGAFTDTGKYSAGFFILADRYPGGIDKGAANKTRTVFGDSTVTDGFIGFKYTGGHTCVSSQFIGMVKSGEITDFSDKSSSDHQSDTGYGRENVVQLFKFVQAYKSLDFRFNFLNLAFVVKQVLGYLKEHLILADGKPVIESCQKQFKGSAIKDSGTLEIILQKDSVGGVDQGSVMADQSMAMSGQFTERAQGFIRDKTGQTFIAFKLTSSQQQRQFAGIPKVSFGLSPFIRGGFDGVGQNQPFHLSFQEIEQPVIKTDCFDYDGTRMQRGLCKKLLDFTNTLTRNSFLNQNLAFLVAAHDSHAVLMKIHAYIRHFFLRVIRTWERVISLFGSVYIHNRFFMEVQNV